MDVIVSTGFIDTLIYTSVALGIVIALVFALWGIQSWRTPRESKEIRNASNAKKTLNIIATSEGKFKFRWTEKTGHEGSAMTKPEGKDKKHWTGFLARPGKTANIAVSSLMAPEGATVEEVLKANEEAKNLQSKTEAMAQFLNAQITRKSYLEGARIPVQFAVEDKALIASIFGIAGIQVTEAMLEAFPDIPIDMNALKRMVVSNSWNESQINAQEEDMKEQGRLEAKRKSGLKESWIPWLIGGGIFFGGLAALVAVIYFLR
jgi:hypothetical protein